MNTASANRIDLASAYHEVFEQFVDNASALWLMRSVAVGQPHYTPADIEILEQRLQAQIDGLLISPDDSWPLCQQALELNDAGDTFVAAVLAFSTGDVKRIQTVVEAGLGDEESASGLVSALGWLDIGLVGGWIDRFFDSKNLDHKYLALAAASVRREDPGDALERILEREDCRGHDKLYARALRLIGELGRLDLAAALEPAQQAEQEDIRFWANRSAILLGDRAALENIRPFVFADGPYQQRAIDIGFRGLAVEQGQAWVKQLAGDELQQRAVIRATGVLADPHAVPWLIAKMEQAEFARVAGEAFSNITGIDLEKSRLEVDPADALPPQPSDEPEDDDVTLDGDENLPWPDVDKVKRIWQHHGQNFTSGERYFQGRRIETELLRSKLESAGQRQRHAAAMELALLDGGAPLSNTQARVMPR